MTPEDFKHDDGYWIFSDKKLYLLSGSLMNQTWLIVTELMKRRQDLNKDFLWPFRKKLEKALSIPESIVRDADLESMNREEQVEEQIELLIKPLGIRRLKKDEQEKR